MNQNRNNAVADGTNDISSFFSRIAQHDAARKGVAAAIAGVVVATVSELIWPSSS